MAITLISYPVTIFSGKVRNIFAGFAPVEIELSRKDIDIVSVSQGNDNKVLISVAGNIVSALKIGEWVYLYSETSTYIYDGSFQILGLTFSSPNTEITIDTEYIDGSSIGYCNYKQNWFLESKLVNVENNDILAYPQILQNDGNPNGQIFVNTSMLVDFLRNEMKTTSQQILKSRAKCKVMYREVWRENSTNSFTLIDEIPIIIIFAAENYEIESFVNGFDIPKIYDGYPFAINLIHSNENNVNERINITFDELDINKDPLTIYNPLFQFKNTDFGILQANFLDSPKIIDMSTHFLNYFAATSVLPDFETGDFDDNDFQTINTP